MNLATEAIALSAPREFAKHNDLRAYSSQDAFSYDRFEVFVMLDRFYVLACLCFVLVTQITGCGAPPPPDVPFAVGTKALFVNVAALPQAAQAQVWYPAEKTTRERTVFYTSAYWGHAKPNAPTLKEGRFPLIVLSHGWRGTRFDLSWIAEDLARRGYIVASLNSVDADAASYQNAQAPKLWFRAQLLSRLIDTLADDQHLAPLVDTRAVGVIGHSAGGSTAFVLGGARLDPQRFAQVFPESAPVVEGDFSDPRIRAVVALNPGTGPAFSAQSVAHLQWPTLILTGTADNIAPAAKNAQFYANSLPSAQLYELKDADHYTFMPICSIYARLRHFGDCIETVPTVDRQAIHDASLGYMHTFLQKNLPTQLASKS